MRASPSAALAAWVAAVGAGVTVAYGALAHAQTVPAARPLTLVVGTPQGGAPADRIDGARTGSTSERLPAGNLERAWQAALRIDVGHAPVVDARGTIYVVGTRGNVVAVDGGGSELWRVSTGARDPGPAALLSDGTLVFVDAGGQAYAVRAGAERWRVRLGFPRHQPPDDADPPLAARGTLGPAPLPLPDGGVVVATEFALVVLDCDGRERARTLLPEPVAAPLVSALGKVVALTTSGAVWAWPPGSPEACRAGTLDTPTDGGAALAGPHTLVAVTGDGQHLVTFDLMSGKEATLAIAPAGAWLGPPATRARRTYLLAMTTKGEIAEAIDASGAEEARALSTLGAAMAPRAVDGGTANAVRVAGTPPLIDADETMAFATLDGSVGVVSLARRTPVAGRVPIPGEPWTDGEVELVRDVCPRLPPSYDYESLSGGRSTVPAPVAGLAPVGEGSFVAACRRGGGGDGGTGAASTLVAFRAAGASQRAARPGRAGWRAERPHRIMTPQ